MSIEQLSDEVIIKKSRQSCGDGNLQRLFLDEAVRRGIHDGSYALKKFKESADRVGLVFDPKF
jgi:hypothetical protein